MEVKMYNVNFGEAIMYQYEGHSLLVDCGAKYYGKGVDAYNAIKADFAFGKDDILITHFDEDHFNGLIEMANDGKVIHRLYLPRYIFKNKNVHNADNYFVDQLRSIMYLHALGKKNRLNTIQKLFISIPKLTAPYFDIRTVAYRDIIKVGSADFKVLWPEDDSYLSFRPLSSELREICIESIAASAANIEQLDNAINNYIELFFDFYSLTEEKEQVIDNPKLQYSELGERFDAAHGTLEEVESELGIVVSEDNIKIVNSKFSNLIRSQNDCSVVFSYESEILALGDASKKIVRHLCDEGRIKEKYKLLKAPHHGTRSYYSDFLPNAEYVFISNSGNKQLNWSISEKYPNRYTNKMLCNNDELARCDWLNNGNPKCTNCSLCDYHLDPVHLII